MMRLKSLFLLVLVFFSACDLLDDEGEGDNNVILSPSEQKLIDNTWYVTSSLYTSTCNEDGPQIDLVEDFRCIDPFRVNQQRDEYCINEYLVASYIISFEQDSILDGSYTYMELDPDTNHTSNLSYSNMGVSGYIRFNNETSLIEADFGDPLNYWNERGKFTVFEYEIVEESENRFLLTGNALNENCNFKHQIVLEKTQAPQVYNLGLIDVGRTFLVANAAFFVYEPLNYYVGFVYSGTESPTMDDEVFDISASFQNNEFLTDVRIENLEPGQTYFARPFYTDYERVWYGKEFSFTTDAYFTEGGGVTDIDNNTYRTIILGSQEWMAENLKVSRYNNGDEITHITEQIAWNSTWNTETAAWSYYDNNNDYNDDFGKLYNWYAVDDNRGICPQGWRVPSNQDWEALIAHLGGVQAIAALLKDDSDDFWTPDDGNNLSGFSARPGGVRGSTFNGLGEFGVWHSSDRSGDFEPPVYYKTLLANVNNFVTAQYYSASAGMSCRCVKDL